MVTTENYKASSLASFLHVGLLFLLSFGLIGSNAYATGCNTYAVSVAHSTGNISNASYALGAPNNSGAYFYRGTSGTYSRLVVDMGATVVSGKQICILVKAASSGTSNLTLWYNTDGNPTSGGYTSIQSLTVTETSWTEKCITLPAGCRYFKITDNGGTSFYVDAVYQKGGAGWDLVALGSNESCAGACDGTILYDPNFNVTGDFTVSYTYNGQTITSGTQTGPEGRYLTGLCPGVYSNFTITGVNTGCTAVWPNNITIAAGGSCGNCVPGVIGGVDLSGLADKYLFFFADGSTDANWQGASKGFAGDVLIDGILANERTSGSVPYAGTIYTNASTQGAWQNIINQNSGQASGSTGNTSLVSAAKAKLNQAFTQINAMPVSSGYASVSASSLHGLNTQNGTAETFVINVTSGFSISSKINITGDAEDAFILRWDTDANFSNGYQGTVKFQSGGAIVPLGGLKPGNFVHVAGDINASGGGSNPASPYPQGPRFDDGTGALIAGGSNFSGGGFFTGYWLTTGSPSTGQTQSLSNGIFVGGWYTTTTKFSETSGTSGVYVSPACDDTPPSGPEGWNYACGDDVEVDLYGYNAKCKKTVTINIPTPSNVFKAVVELVWKGNNPGSTLTIEDQNGNTYVLNRDVPEGGSSNVWVYRGELNTNISSIYYDVPDNIDCSLQSVVVYAFRTVADAGTTAGLFTGKSGYNDIQSIAIPIPTDDDVRDLTIDLPISELTTDGRYIKITATAGGVSNSIFIYGPDASLPGGGCCLAIPTITLAGVPGSATEVTITLDSRNGQNGQSVNGQSWTVAGSVNVNLECAECVTEGGQIEGDETFCTAFDPGVISNVIAATASGCPDIIVPESCCENGDGAAEFTFKYTGESCAASDNNQGDIGSKWDCSGDALLDNQVYIIYNNDDDPASGDIYFSGNVAMNTTFTASAANAGATKFNSNTYAHIFNQQGGTVIQTIRIHASCSAPIVTGDQFGSLILVTADFENGYACGQFDQGPDYIWQIKPTGGSWSTISGASGASYDPAAITVTTEYRRISTGCCADDTSNVVIKSIVPESVDGGEISGDEEFCAPFDASLIENVRSVDGTNCSPSYEVESCCGPGDKGAVFTFQFTGEECSASQNNQGDIGSKWNCTGALNGDSEVYIVANDQSGTNLGGDIYFEGSVSINDIFVASAANAGQTNFSSNTYYHILTAQGGTQLQLVQIHASCSAPIVTGDQFGSLILLSADFENGYECGSAESNVSYEWLTRPQGSSQWTLIPGATEATYNPGMIDVNTEFARIGTNCCGSDTSNIVLKEIVPESIDPGMISGNEEQCGPFDAALITSTRDVDATGCGPELLVESCCEDGNYTASLTLQYTGENCAASDNNQGSIGNKWDCSGDPAFDNQVYIVVNDESGTSTGGNVYFEGYVPINTTFTALASNAGQTKFSSNTYFHIFNQQNGAQAQLIQVHTSCSVPIVTGDQFGSLILLSAGFENGFTCGSGPATADYQWITRPEGTTAWTLIPGATATTYDPGQITENTEFARIATTCCGSDTSNIVVKRLGGADPGEIEGDEANCGPYDPEVINNVTSAFTVDCPVNFETEMCCGDEGLDGFKIQKMLMKYTGESCSATFTNQDPGKYTCSGDPAGDPQVYIIVNDKDDANDGKIFFAGNVTLNGNYLIDATNAGETRLQSDTRIHVFNQQGGTKIQYIKFHTSCSQELYAGDQFGANLILSMVSEDGIDCGFYEEADTTITYQWQVWNGTNWVDIPGATNETYDPGPITETTKYRRNASTCCGIVESNEVVKTVYGEPVANAGNDQETCGQQSVTLTATASGGTAPYIFEWNTGETTATITVEPEVTATYTVTVIDANGCTDTDDVTVTVHPEPVVSITKVDATCGFDNGSATASANGGTSPYSYSWNTGATTATISSLAPGTYTVTVTDANGCTATKNTTIDNIPGPTASATGDEICAGETATISGSATGGTPPFSYSWSNGAGNTATVSVTPAQTTTYTLTITDANQCVSTATATVTVNPNPVVDAGPDVTNCGQQETILTATVTSGTGPFTYEWNTGETTASITVEPEITFTYTVTVTDSKGCTDTDGVTVTVNPEPVAFARPDTTICLGASVDLVGSAQGGTAPYTYSWSNGVTTANQTVTPQATTTYTLTITDAEGCTATDNVTVTVSPNACAGLGDFVWEDLDADGIQDSGEPGIGGVTVYLLDGNGNYLDTTTTDNTGYYEFINLVPGDYIVQFVGPNGYDASPDNEGGNDAVDSDAGANGQTGIINLSPQEFDPTNDAGFYQPASLGDYVWEDLNGDGIQDAGEPPVPGVTVYLKDENGNIIDTTTTNNVGFYEFTDLVPGTYSVQFVLPDGFVFAPLGQGGEAEDSDADPNMNGMTATVTLQSGDNYPDLDAGLIKPASLGDYVWEDLDGDGIQDAGEPPVPGVTVYLKDENGNIIDTTTTNSVGFYEFTDLAPGTYSVQFVLPEGFVFAPLGQGGETEDSDADPNMNGMTATVTLQSGDNYPDLDAGLIKPASLGDYVWEDLDGDGIQDAGEPPVPGVTVYLKDENGNIIDTTTTNNVGFYEFTDLAPGTYSVQFVLPDGFVFAPLGQGGEAEDSDADPNMNGMTETVTLQSGDNYPDLDAGLIKPASLGDYVWEDLDGDGIQDAGEPPVPGVTVYLKDENGNIIDTTTTNNVGFYEFTDLAPGTYSVQFVLPDGFVFAPLGQGGEAEDSDADPNMNGMTATVTLQSGDNYPDLDAGLIKPASLGDYVWEDLDGDGIQDAGEPPVPGVTVYLKDENGNIIDTTTTNNVGFYEFTDLAPGTYSVQFVLPDGFVFAPLGQGGEAEDSDADPNMNGMTATVTLQSGDNYPDLDAGLIKPASLGDYVWEDLDGDGIQDAGEPPVPGVTVYLKDENGNIIDTTTTNNVGFYEFTDLAPGTYSVQFVLPDGFVFAPLGQGGEAEDSDADPNMNGMTATVTLQSGDNYPDLDAGIIKNCSVTTSVDPGEICAGEPVTVTATVSGGVSPFQYSWNTGQTTASFTANPQITTTYTVTITDAIGCTSESSSTVIVNPNPVVDLGPDIELCGPQTTTLTAGVTNGTGPFTYEWNTGETTTSITVEPEITFTYTVTVTDSKGCTDSDEVTVIVNEEPVVNITPTDATCGFSNGSATASASGGTPPYSYSWNTGATTATITGLAPGGYSVTVTDDNGCTAINTVQIQNIGGPTASATGNEICAGATATISGSVTGGTPPYNYSWSGGAGNTATATVSPAQTTTYTLTVTDANQCVSTATATVIVNPNPVVDLGPDMETCGPEETLLTAGVTSGTGPFTYEWNTGETTAAITVEPEITFTYTVTVTDSKGCTASDEITVIVNPEPVVTIEKTDATCGFSNGSATATAQGGTGSYTYSWNTGATTAAITGLAPGTYTVTVTDEKGCTAVNSTTIQNIGGPTASATGDEICAGATATISGSATGGTPPYNYSWSGGAGNTATATVSPAQTTTYTLTVTDANQCVSTATATVIVNPNPVVDLGPDAETCGPEETLLTAGVTSGTGPFTYEWNTGETTAAITVEPEITFTYTVTVTDSKGCTASDEITVIVNPEPVVTIEKTDATCGFSNGSATATAQGGTGSYTYSWNTGATTATITALAPGTYTVTVTDEEGCTAVNSTTINNIGGPTASATGDEICAGATATISGSATGGTPPYNYSWSGGAGNTATATVSPAQTTTYTLTVTDANQCVSTATATVIVNPNPVVDLGPDRTNCGQEEEVLTAGVTSGTGPFTYEWNTGETTASITVEPEITFTYTVTVTDSKGCTASDEITITVNEEPVVNITKTDATCGLNNGTATAVAQGGTLPYSYSWNTGATTAAITGLAPGTYTVTVTDANECSATNSINIGNIGGPTVTASADAEICRGESTTISASAQGGTPPYTFTWDNGLGQGTSFTVSPTQTTTYTVTVTDANGCSGTDQVTVTVNQPPNVVLEDQFACEWATVTLTPTVTGGTAPYTYLWNNGETTPSIMFMAHGNQQFTVTVTDANGCSTTESMVLTVNGLILITINKQNAQCGLNNGSATANVVGGTPPYTYQWSNGATTQTISGLAPGQYTVVVTDGVQCTNEETTNIINIGGPTAAAEGDEICAGATATISGSATGGTPPYSYSWSNGGNSATIDVSPAQTTTYTLTVTDANECTSTATATVTVNPNPVVDLGDDITNCGQEEVTLAAGVTSGTGPFTYEWNTGETTASITVEPEVTFTYTVTVTDSKGCSATDEITITVNEEPVVTIQKNDATCTQSNGSATATATGGTGPYSYVWNTGATTATITGLAPGTYTVTVTDANGCTATATTTIVNQGQVPTINITMGSKVCSADLLTYSVSFTVSAGTVSLSAGTLVPLGGNSYTATGVPIAQTLTITTVTQFQCVATAQVTPPNCECPDVNPPTGVTEVLACDNKPIPTLVVFTGPNNTADWFDAATGGNLLAAGTTSYQPTAAGEYFVQTRSLVNDCISERILITVTLVDCGECPTPDCLELQIER